MLLSSSVLGADSVILDLEDAVALNQKDSARILVREAIKNLDFSNVEVMVRINPVGTPYWKEDLQQIIPVKPDIIMIPKATKDDVIAVEKLVKELEQQHQLSTPVRFVLIAETAYGVETIVDTLKASQRIDGVLLGAEDFTTDMEIMRTKEGQEIEYARNKIAISAKALINPRQVDVVHEVFSPSEEEINNAKAILLEQEKALSKGLGVFSFKGKMVDQPIIVRAQKTMQLARKLGLE